MLCVIYVTAVGTLLGIVGLLVERMLPTTSARRWVWCAIIPISIALPGFYRMHHSWSLLAALETVPPVDHALPTVTRIALNPAWWVHAQTFDSAISRVWLIVSGVLLLWGLATHCG